MKIENPINKPDNWDSLVRFVSKKFGGGEKLDLQAVLFLIGINELGQGYREFTKDEKLDLLHIAICRLLSKYGYYKYKGRDKEGWPHWETTNKLPVLEPEEQTALMKKAAIRYFLESGILF